MQESSQKARIREHTGGAAESARAFFAFEARLRRKRAARAALRSTSVRVAASSESESLMRADAPALVVRRRRCGGSAGPVDSELDESMIFSVVGAGGKMG